MDADLLMEILILLVGVYLAFFKSYLSEKGKSAALKEDLQELTREVESVKSEFIKDQEFLKTDLQRILNNEISYRDEERNALIQFHSVINEWIYSILEVGYANYNKTNVEKLIEVRNQNASFYAKAGISKSRISLLIEDSELVKATNELYIKVLEFHHWTDFEFLKLQQNCETQKSLTERFIYLFKNYEQNRDFLESMANEEQELKNEVRELFDNYIKNRNAEYAKLNSFEKKFELLVKEYLRK